MMENENYYENLILKYAWREELTEDEQEYLRQWRNRSHYHNAIPDKFRDIRWVREELKKMRDGPSEQMWPLLLHKMQAGQAAQVTTCRRKLVLFKGVHYVLLILLLWMLLRTRLK